MRRIVGVAFWLLVSAVHLSAQSAVGSTVVDAGGGVKSGDLRAESFEIVWKMVRDKHFDKDFGGVDWDRVKEIYAPKVAAAKNDAEFHLLLQQMLGELRQSHFNIIPPHNQIPEQGREMPAGNIGIDLRIIDGDAVISRIEPRSSAELAGLRTGYIITAVDGKPVKDLFERLQALDESASRKKLIMSRILLGAIGGAPGSEVKLLYRGEKSLSRTASVVRQRLKGELSESIGNFPPQYTEFETGKLAGNIGYIRFNIFTPPVMGKVRTAIRGFSDPGAGRVDGLIFDLRGNPGGLGGMASGIAGMLATSGGSLGTMKSRTTELKFAYFPQAGAFTGPVVIVIDSGSASTSEIFAGGMQEIGRATVVGETSMGAALPSYFHKLPTGALFQMAIADFKTPRGSLIEGRGVIPDFEVKLDRALLLEGRDSQLEKAIEIIRKKAAPARK